MSRPLPLGAALAVVAGFMAPLTFLVWATWFTHASLSATLLLFLAATLITVVVSLFVWSRAISSSR